MNIIITGASSGLGKELAKYYDKEGNNLYLIARRHDRLQQLQAELKCQTKIYSVDVSEFDTLQETTKEIIKDAKNIDLVIANAGISLGHDSGFSEFGNFKRLMDINFLSIHALLEHIVPTMQAQKSGKIAIISSLASIVAMPSSIAYSASKRAINSYCESLRNYLSNDNIDVVNILPGFIKSEMTDKNRFKMPFLLDTTEGVKRIVYAIENSKREYKFPKRFFAIVKLISMLPVGIKDRLIQKVHHKK
jgi:short-subunit dehydrogenase